METILIQIKAEMKKQGISQAILADRLGVSEARISVMLKKPNLQIQTLIKVLNAIGMRARIELIPLSRKV